MLVVEDEIRKRGLVSPDLQIKLKNSTCDLTVGEIFLLGDDRTADAGAISEFWLQPSHMVAVLTAQRIVLPSNVTGIATLVTSLTKEGILCLNAGIVDPGYSGHLSATLVNFSKQPHKIYLDQRLFRVLFIEHSKIKNLESFVQDKARYRRDLISKAKSQFSETFLDVKGTLLVARRTAWKVVRSQLGESWIATLLAIIAILLASIDVFGGAK